MSLAAKPKLPKQIAADTSLRIGHVSRALRELKDRGLTELLTPEVKSRGRLYGLTDSGSQLVAYFRASTNRYVPSPRASAEIGFVPKIRAALALRIVEQLRSSKGDRAVATALKPWSVNLANLRENDWLSIDVYDEFVEMLEAAFGDGSYEFTRTIAALSVPKLGPVVEQVVKLVPLDALAERAPIVYSKEWNYGRLEVETGKGWARFSHFDWSPTPWMCAMFQGTYEGILRARNTRGKVEKVSCVRAGDDRCQYLVKW